MFCSCERSFWQATHADGRCVCDGGLGLVNVLSARSGCAIGVDPQVLRPNLDFRLTLDLRRWLDEREGGLPSLLEIERRDANEPVGAALGLQIAVGVRAFDGQRRTPETSLVSGVDSRSSALSRDARPIADTCAPSSRPIGGIGAADPGGYREDRAPLVDGPEAGLSSRATSWSLRASRAMSASILESPSATRRARPDLSRAARNRPPFQTITLCAEAFEILCARCRPAKVRLGGLGL